MWEIALFLLIGCLGGLIGAGFNALNERLTRWRMLRMRTVRDKCACVRTCLYVYMCWCGCHVSVLDLVIGYCLFPSLVRAIEASHVIILLPPQHTSPNK